MQNGPRYIGSRRFEDLLSNTFFHFCVWAEELFQVFSLVAVTVFKDNFFDAHLFNFEELDDFFGGHIGQLVDCEVLFKLDLCLSYLRHFLALDLLTILYDLVYFKEVFLRM